MQVESFKHVEFSWRMINSLVLIDQYTFKKYHMLSFVDESTCRWNIEIDTMSWHYPHDFTSMFK